MVAFDGTEWRHCLDDMPEPSRARRAMFAAELVLDLDVAPDGKVWVAGADGVFVIDPAAA